MVLASGKLKFVKNTGRASASKGTHVAKKKSKAITKHTKGRLHSKTTHRRRSSKGGGRINPLHIALAAAGVAYAVGGAGPAFIKTNVAKIPGAKTFGNEAALGIACLAIDRFAKPNKWLRLAGYVGIVAGAMKFGQQGSQFKWLGDMGGDGDMMDMGDDDMGDDDE